jgi:hypothetical protein
MAMVLGPLIGAGLSSTSLATLCLTLLVLAAASPTIFSPTLPPHSVEESTTLLPSPSPVRPLNSGSYLRLLCGYGVLKATLGLLETLFPLALSAKWSLESIGGAMFLTSLIALSLLLFISTYGYVSRTFPASLPTVAILLSASSALLCLLFLPPEGSSGTDLLLLCCLFSMGSVGYPLLLLSLVLRALDTDRPASTLRLPLPLLPFFGVFEAVGFIARLGVPWLLQHFSSQTSPRLALGSYVILLLLSGLLTQS